MCRCRQTVPSSSVHMQIVICSTQVLHTCSRFGKSPSQGTSGALTILNCVPSSKVICSVVYSFFFTVCDVLLEEASVPCIGCVGVAPLRPGKESLSSTMDCRFCICCSLSCSDFVLSGTGYFRSMSDNCLALCSSFLHSCTVSTSDSCSGPPCSRNTFFSIAS